MGIDITELKQACCYYMCTMYVCSYYIADSELTFDCGKWRECTSVTYDRFDDIQTFTLFLTSEDKAAVLSTSQAEMTVIPQHVFMQEDVLLEVLLSGLTIDTVSIIIFLDRSLQPLPAT